MMMLLHFSNHFSEETAGRAAQVAAKALVAGLWQGIALAAVTGLVLSLVPRTTATVRFMVWSVVFCVSAAMPLVHLYRAAAGPLTAASSFADSGARLQLDARWSYLLAGLWVAAAVWRLGALALQAVELRALWRGAMRSSSSDELAAGRRVQVCTSDEVDRPSVIGFFAPRILIPAWLYEQLSEVELRHIVLHEMEHLRRRDDWMNLLQKIGLVLFPLNPALFWIDRRLSAEREIACDDGVLERTKAPRAYAASLTSIAERRLDQRLHRRMVALALATIGAGTARRGSEFGRRIESILGKGMGRRTVFNRAATGALAAALVAGIAGAAAGMLRVPDLVSFAGSASHATAARPSDEVAGQSRGAIADLIQPVAERILPAQSQYQNASFRAPQTAGRPLVKPAIPALISSKRASAAAVPIDTKAVSPSSQAGGPARPQGQLMVLTTWEQTRDGQGDVEVVPVTRVVVRTPDGRFFVAPYAALPTQAGWLIVQL